MDKIKRYYFGQKFEKGDRVYSAIEDKNGDYILYSDAESLNAEISRLQEQLRLANVDQANTEAELNEKQEEVERLTKLLNTPLLKSKESLIKTNEILLKAVQSAYRKYVQDSEYIGSYELDDILLNALCSVMGEREFQEWSWAKEK